FPQLLLGVLFARGRRTVTAWFRAAGISDAYRQGYHTLAAAGRGADFLSTRVLPVVASLQPADRLSVALDDTPTPRWGPHVEGAGVHRNPTPARPASSTFTATSGLPWRPWSPIPLRVSAPCPCAPPCASAART